MTVIEIIRALKLEYSNNPLRSSLAILQTTAILIGVVQYVREAWQPSTTQLGIPTLLLQVDPDGSFRGDLMVSADTGPSANALKIKVYGVSEDKTTYLIRDLDSVSVSSGQIFTVARLKIKNPSEQILFCINGKNERGATLNQNIVVEQDGSATSKFISQSLRAYKSIPQAEMPKTPACP